MIVSTSTGVATADATGETRKSERFASDATWLTPAGAVASVLRARVALSVACADTATLEARNFPPISAAAETVTETSLYNCATLGMDPAAKTVTASDESIPREVAPVALAETATNAAAPTIRPKDVNAVAAAEPDARRPRTRQPPERVADAVAISAAETEISGDTAALLSAAVLSGVSANI